MSRAVVRRLAFASALALTLVPTPVDAQSRSAEPNDSTAVWLSLLLPGVGEWYNAGFQGGYPTVECITGQLCPCIRLASMLDAAARRTDDGIRFDFWASPVSQKAPSQKK